MATVILFEKATQEIVYAIPRPHGSAKEPNQADLIKSARIPWERFGEFATVKVPGAYLTEAAKEKFRIIGGEVVLKPTLTLDMDATGAPLYIVSVSIGETRLDEIVDSVRLSVDDTEISVALTGNSGSVAIELIEPGTYRIGSGDDRFQPVAPIVVEVI